MNDLRGPYAHFSPSVFCITWSFPFPGTRFADDPLVQIDASLAQDHPAFEANWDLAKRHAAVFHEKRHFYDWIGTPLGMVLFDHGQRIINQYLIRLAPHIRSLDNLMVPLIRYWEEPTAPTDVREFLKQYLWNQGYYGLLMSDVSLPKDYASDQWLSEYVDPNTRSPIPVVRLPEYAYSVGGELRSHNREYFPLGGIHILECLAFSMEAWYARQELGPAYEMRLYQEMHSGPNAWVYGLVKAVARRVLGALPMEAVLIGCEFALCVPGRRSDPCEFHPGWRLIRYLFELSDTTDFSIGGIGETIDRLCRKENWIHPIEALRQGLTYAAAQIKHNTSGPEGQLSVVKEYNAIYYQYAETMLKERLANGFPIRNPCLYFRDLAEHRFPRQPLSRFLDGERYRLIGPEGGSAREAVLIHWLFLEHLVHDLVLNGNMTCPMKPGGSMERSCPFETRECGAGIAYRIREPGMCPYGDVLYGLGLIEGDGVATTSVQRFDDLSPELKEYYRNEQQEPKDRNCDICGHAITESQMSVMSGLALAQIARSGFLPSRLPFSRPELTRDNLRELWLQTVNMNARSDWGFCPLCWQEIKEYEEE